jgi:hypothetical protein
MMNPKVRNSSINVIGYEIQRYSTCFYKNGHIRRLARLIGLRGEVSANSAGNTEVSANSEGRFDIVGNGSGPLPSFSLSNPDAGDIGDIGDMGVYELPGSSKTRTEDGIVEDPDKAADDGG